MSRLVFAAALAAAGVVSAAMPVTSVVSYSQGAGVSGYADSLAATGFPDDLTGEGIGFPNILSPFSPAFEDNEIVGIGKGGHITLKFPAPVAIVAGLEFGVFTNVGLIDVLYPNGVNANPAGTFDPAPRVADAEVSLDGVSFFSVGRYAFENPTNFFSDASDPYATAVPPGASMADFGATFAFGLSAFSGRSWVETLALLHGTAGGTWIDADAALPGLGVPEYQYVRFSIPADGIAGSDNKVFVDAVFASDNTLIPEPVLASGFFATLLVCFRRR